MKVDFFKIHPLIEIPFENVDFYQNINNDILSLKLGTEQNEIYGAIRLQKKHFLGEDYYQITRIFTTEKHRKKGVMKLLYSQCLELNYKLMSDATQTTFGSKDFWIKAKDYFTHKNIFIIFLENHEVLPHE